MDGGRQQQETKYKSGRIVQRSSTAVQILLNFGCSRLLTTLPINLNDKGDHIDAESQAVSSGAPVFLSSPVLFSEIF